MGPNVAYAIEHLNGQQMLATLDEITATYLAAFAEPPYSNDTDAVRRIFMSRLTGRAEAAGFDLVTARTHAGALVGFAQGAPMGDWWPDALQPPPAQVVAASRFYVSKLGVLPAHRRRGLARRLMDALLAGRPEQVAVLLADPDAIAHGMYGRWGWTAVGPVPAPGPRGYSDAFTYYLELAF